MKTFREVEENRRAYHQDATRNSVHRSSLTIPELPGCSVDVSFLNHFQIKRGYDNVGCRVTAVDAEGQRIDSRLYPVDEPRAYTIPLTGMVPQEVETYLVEFYSADNLFIPFPAAMVNHAGDGFLNTVHSYNRTLNDPFEDDLVNSKSVPEASIDVRIDSKTDTFAVFTAGPRRCVGELEVELSLGETCHSARVPLDVPRFANELVSLHGLFPDLDTVEGGVLRIWQPSQPMFYGRMLAGQRYLDGAFSANHSYYDNSGIQEYWDTSDGSYRVYPLLSGVETILRIYPIMSPGGLRLTVDANGANGKKLCSITLPELNSPNGSSIDANIGQLLAKDGIDDARSITVRAAPLAGNTPTRINHQIVYADLQRRSPLASSINVSLFNQHMFVPQGKGSFIWGQVPIGPQWQSNLGVVCNLPVGEDTEVDISFYGEKGLLDERRFLLSSLESVELDVREIADKALSQKQAGNAYVWYTARSSRPDLSAFAVTVHDKTGHATGEHNF